MARAMIGGLIKNGFPVDHIWASSPNVQKHEAIKSKFSIHLTSDNVEAAKHADIIVFAVKPWVMETVCAELKKVIQDKNPLIISLVTGTQIASMTNWLSHPHCALIRTMPNIASAVGAGATGLFANPHTTSDQKDFAESLFRSVGAADSPDISFDRSQFLAGVGIQLWRRCRSNARNRSFDCENDSGEKI